MYNIIIQVNCDRHHCDRCKFKVLDTAKTGVTFCNLWSESLDYDDVSTYPPDFIRLDQCLGEIQGNRRNFY